MNHVYNLEKSVQFPIKKKKKKYYAHVPKDSSINFIYISWAQSTANEINLSSPLPKSLSLVLNNHLQNDGQNISYMADMTWKKTNKQRSALIKDSS